MKKTPGASGILFLAAIASGLALYLSSPGTAGTGLLAWVALVPLLVVVRNLPAQRAFLTGFTCGTVFYLALLYWIVIVLGRYGYLPLWVSVPALVFLALYMSLYLGLFAAAASIFIKRRGAILFLPATWVALDFLRAYLFTGFPWMDIAYTQYRLPLLIQISDLAGHHAVSFMIVVTNLLAASLFLHFREKKPLLPLSETIITLVALVAMLLYGNVRYNGTAGDAAAEKQLPVAVIQGNISQDQKWDPEVLQFTVDTYLSLSRQALEKKPATLLVWPETALPYFPAEDGSFATIATELLSASQASLLTGAPHRIFDENTFYPAYYNSAFLVDSSGHVADRYDKHHLVPFGEYIPFRSLLPMLAPVVETMGDFDRGVGLHPLACQNFTIGVLICFESIFPELARKQVQNGAQILANITNDAWFGKSSAPMQHLAMAVFRAVETRRSLIRAANTGISALIAPSGRLAETSPLFEPYFLTGDVSLLQNKTFFVRYGHQFPAICLGAAVVGLITALRNRREYTSR